MKIRITSQGMYGLPVTDENPTGEYPIGHELDIGDSEPPVGWVGRYEIVGGKAPKDAELVVNPADAGQSQETDTKRGPGRPKSN